MQIFESPTHSIIKNKTHSRRPLTSSQKMLIHIHSGQKTPEEIAQKAKCGVSSVYRELAKTKAERQIICSNKSCHRKHYCRKNTQVIYMGKIYCCQLCVLDYQGETEGINVPENTQIN